MHRSTSRILTTHTGSLPRPPDLVAMLNAKELGEPYDAKAFAARVERAISEVVQKQVDTGIDVIGDGEHSKFNWMAYARARLTGLEEIDSPVRFRGATRDSIEFAGAYEDLKVMHGARSGALVAKRTARPKALVCAAPIRYVGHDELRTDLANLRRSLAGKKHDEAFVTAISPSNLELYYENRHYNSDEEYLEALGEAMRVEYLAIVEAGFLLQIDDPFLCDVFVDPDLGSAAAHRKASLYVEAVNHSLRGIAPERVRYHTCYGINEGPRIHEAALADVVGYMLRVNAGAYSFEAANCRHEHEYHLWEEVTLPDGKAIIPGVITHASNIVEHPQLIAERLTRFGKLVGRERVIAGVDCGFSSQACYRTEVHPTVIWTKFQALAEGARIASRRLF